ncbi:Cysteine synthase A [Entamoeba marina]
MSYQTAPTAKPRNEIYKNVLETIGGTPLVSLRNIAPPNVKMLAKLEYFNPMGSVKDRIAYNILFEAERTQKLKPGMTVLEATSGNTGIGLCQAAAVMGYPCTLIMPESMSMERRLIMQAFGAELILTDKSTGVGGSVAHYNKLLEEYPDKYFPVNQFGNEDNKRAHEHTAEEIWADTNGEVDVVVSAIGTSGTIVGISEWLKKKKDVKMVGVEPCESAVLSGKQKGPHGIQGIGAGFVPDLYEKDDVDELVCVKTADAWKMARTIARFEGILCGMSSGAAMLAACRLAKKKEYENKTIVVIFPSCGERYLSTDLYKTFDKGTKEEIMKELLE